MNSIINHALFGPNTETTGKAKKRKSSEVYSPDSVFLRLDYRTFDHFGSDEWYFITPGEEPFDLDEPSLVCRYFEAEYTIMFDPPEQVWYDDIYPLSQLDSLYPGISSLILTLHELSPTAAAMKAYIHTRLLETNNTPSCALDLPALSEPGCRG